MLGVADAPEGHFVDNAALALNAHGSRLACSAGSEAKLWDVGAKRLLQKWELPPALTEAAAFHPDGRLLLVRQETKGRKLAPFTSADPINDPRVCRLYELPDQGAPKQIAEILDFDTYVEHIAITPNAAYFAIQGNSTSAGTLARIIHLFDGSTGKQVGSIPTTIPPNDSATWMRFDPKGTRLHTQTRPRMPAEIFDVPCLKAWGRWRLAVARTSGSRGVSGSIRRHPARLGLVWSFSQIAHEPSPCYESSAMSVNRDRIR